MHYTSLNNGLGEHGVDGVREALQAIDDRDQDIGDAAVLELVHDAHPELCAFGLLDPDPEDFLGPVGQYAECDIYGFVAEEAFVADFDSDRIEEHTRVKGIERAPLPLGDRLPRSGERSAGKECVSTGRNWGWPYHKKKKN